MEAYSDMLVENNELLQKLKREFEGDFAVDATNIHDKSRMTAGLKSKWVEMWIRHRRLMKVLEGIRKDKKETYVREHGRPDIVKTRTEKEANSTEEIQKMDLQILKMSDVVDYLYQVMTVAHGFGYDLSHVVEIMKMESR